jgi:hypothetical protein
MFKFNIEEIYSKNYVITLDFNGNHGCKIMSGCIIDEDTIISEYYKNKKTMSDAMDVDSTNVSSHSQGSPNISSSENQINSSPNFSNPLFFLNNPKSLEKVYKLLLDTDIIIISNLQEILILPYFLNKFNFETNKFKIITTEPIIQIARYYLKEFYNSFNKILIQGQGSSEENLNFSDEKFSEKNLSDNIFSINSTSSLVNENFIISFIENLEKMNYLEKYDIQPYLKLVLSSSGYDLGSSNIILHFFDKKISILSKWSLFRYRYPKEFDINSLSNSDIFIPMPDIINYHNDYEINLSNLNSEIYKITSKQEINSNHYPTILMPTEWSFILDFVDILRYKVSKELKNIYISSSIKAIVEYANISHGFINNTIHNKIYEFKLPFGFDELSKNEQFYHFSDFEDFLKNFLNIAPLGTIGKKININNSPIVFMVNKFSFTFGEAQIIFENFYNNSKNSSTDALIYLNKISSGMSKNLFESKNFIHNCFNENSISTCNVSDPDPFKTFSFNLDFRGSFEQFRFIIDEIKPGKFYYSHQETKNLDFVKFILNKNYPNDMEKISYTSTGDNIIDFDINEIKYKNIYFLGRDNKEFDNFLINSEKNYEKDKDKTYNILVERENDNLYVQLQSQMGLLSKNKIDEKNYLEAFEEDLNLMLQSNNMKINEFLCKENSIKFSIVRTIQVYANSQIGESCETHSVIKNEEYFSDVNMNINNKGSYSIDLTCECSDDSEFLNEIFRLIF